MGATGRGEGRSLQKTIMSLIVQKYGGTSMGSVERIEVPPYFWTMRDMVVFVGAGSAAPPRA